MQALAGRHEQRLVTSADLGDAILADAATVVLSKVADKRATFTRANLRRVDGTSMLRARNSEVHATREILEAEARLLAAGQALDAPVVDAHVTARLATPVPSGAGACGRSGADARSRRASRLGATPRRARRRRRHRKVRHHVRGARRLGSQLRGGVSGRPGPVGGLCAGPGRGRRYPHREHRQVARREPAQPTAAQVPAGVCRPTGHRLPLRCHPPTPAAREDRARRIPALDPATRAAGHHRRGLHGFHHRP